MTIWKSTSAKVPSPLNTRQEIATAEVYEYIHRLQYNAITFMSTLYYLVASPVQPVENTHVEPTPSLRPGFPLSQCMSRRMSQCKLLQMDGLGALRAFESVSQPREKNLVILGEIRF